MFRRCPRSLTGLAMVHCTLLWSHKPRLLNGRLGKCKIGGCKKTFCQPFASPSPTFRQPFANLFCQPHLQPPLSMDPRRGLSGPLNRLNAMLSLLHPLDRYRTPFAIGSAIGRPYLALSRFRAQLGTLNCLVLKKLVRGLIRAIVALRCLKPL